MAQANEEIIQFEAVHRRKDGSLFPVEVSSVGATVEGTQSQVIHSRRPLIMNDLQKQLGKPGSIAVKVGTDEKYTHSALYVPMLAKGQVAGVMQVQSYAPGRYTPSDADLLSFIGNTAAIAILNAQLVERLQHYDRELEHACDSALESWSRTLDLRDKETEDHTRRVTALTVRLARANVGADE